MPPDAYPESTSLSTLKAYNAFTWTEDDRSDPIQVTDYIATQI